MAIRLDPKVYDVYYGQTELAPKLEMLDERGQQVFLAPSTKDTKK